MKTSKFAMVSGFVPPPGRPRFGCQRQITNRFSGKWRLFQKKRKRKKLILKMLIEKSGFDRLRDPLFSGKIMRVFLRNLKIAFFEKNVKMWKIENLYCNLDVGRLQGSHFIPWQIYLFLRILKFAFFQKRCKKHLPYIILLFWVPLLRTEIALFDTHPINDAKSIRRLSTENLSHQIQDFK